LSFPLRVLGKIKIFFTFLKLIFIDTLSVPFFSQGAKTWNGMKNYSEYLRILVTGTVIKIEI
jgi:hypothetical protein